MEINSDNRNPSLSEAASRFLASLPPAARALSQQEVSRFVRWYGRERVLAELTAPDIANYAEQLSLSDTDYIKKLGLIQAFLVYASKEGWSKRNLAPHLKAKKGKPRRKAAFKQNSPETISLTQQGYTALEAELVTLKGKRAGAIDEVRRAAADKDFRENAPLDAAREQYGHLEGQIKELEETLKLAVILDGTKEVTLKVGTGDSITLRDLASGEELHYMMVSSKEVDPARGKISRASPIGKAVNGRGQGEVIEVIAPAGKLRYRLEQIER